MPSLFLFLVTICLVLLRFQIVDLSAQKVLLIMGTLFLRGLIPTVFWGHCWRGTQRIPKYALLTFPLFMCA